MADAVCNDQGSEQGSEQTRDMEHQNTATETRIARLMITKIVNENFKSYAGTQELGPFHKVICFCCLGRLELTYVKLKFKLIVITTEGEFVGFCREEPFRRESVWLIDLAELPQKKTVHSCY